MQVRDLIIGRDVVMKASPSDVSPPESAMRRIIEEARIIGRLQHPNIPQVYEVGLDEKGRPFYTMREPKGANLRQILDDMKAGKTRTIINFTVRRTIAIFQKVCDAVAFAHSKEILHRNLKPENIVIGDYGEVFITGWDATLNSEHFSDARQAGLNPYPDIAALGKILYEIITLSSPQDRNRLSNESGGSDQRGMFMGSARVGGTASKAYETLLGAAKRAMARQSHNSYHSVREFQREVDTYKDSFDDPSETLALTNIFRQLFKGHKWVLATMIAILLIFITLVVLLVSRMRSPASAMQKAPAAEVHKDVVASDHQELERLTTNDASAAPVGTDR